MLMADPRIDPRLVIAASEAVVSEIGGGRDQAEFVTGVVLDAALRAAREAGADAVTVDGGLVRHVETNKDLPVTHRVFPVVALVPLDGGDDE